MFNVLFNFIIKIVFGIISVISNIIITPIIGVVSLIFPSFDDFLNTALNFFNNNILNGVGFVKEIILNLSGFPRPLFKALITYYLLKISFYVGIKLFRFISNMLNTVGIIHLGPGMEE